jgi:hypothetical protein
MNVVYMPIWNFVIEELLELLVHTILLRFVNPRHRTSNDANARLRRRVPGA